MERTDIIKCILVAFVTLVVLKFVFKMFQKEDKQIKTRNALETPFPEPLNEENQQVNIENWAAENNLEGKVIVKMIQETHSKCPVMGDHRPKVSVCIQNPKTNKGYIISLCCPHCLEKIQTSFKRNDKLFTIRKLNHVDVLYYKNKPRQIAIPCNRMNMEEVMKLMGTRPL